MSFTSSSWCLGDTDSLFPRVTACTFDTVQGGVLFCLGGGLVIWYLLYLKNYSHREQLNKPAWLGGWYMACLGLLIVSHLGMMGLELTEKDASYAIHPSKTFYNISATLFHILMLLMIVIGTGRNCPIPRSLPTWYLFCAVYASQSVALSKEYSDGQAKSINSIIICCVQIVISLGVVVMDFFRCGLEHQLAVIQRLEAVKLLDMYISYYYLHSCTRG